MSAFRKRVSRCAVSITMSAAVLMLAGCAATDGPQTTLVAQGSSSQSIRALYDVFAIAALVVFVVVEGILIYSVFRFRRRPGEGIPVQIHGNKPIEIIWTIIPSVIVLFLATMTFRTQATLGQQVQQPLRVKVIGHQWWWEFQYPEYKIVTANEVHLPANRDVEFQLQSADVIHSFWLPRLAGKTDTVPGHTNVLSFRLQDTQQPVIIRGECAEFCGGTHAQMGMHAVVEPQAAFDAWVRRQQTPAPAGSAAGTAAQGAGLFKSKGCTGCHAIAGRADAQGVVGPNLTHVGSRQHIVAGWLTNTPENMQRWLRDPNEVKPENIMGSAIKRGTLDENEIAALTAYLESLK